MANVRKLMRLAREYEAESGRDLRGFIDYLDEQELLRARERERAAREELERLQRETASTAKPPCSPPTAWVTTRAASSAGASARLMASAPAG
jgi:hypothetical protein